MKSELETALAFQIRVSSLPEPVCELRFHDTRRWRFDFAFPEQMLAAEVVGGTWSGGRHVRGSGIAGDYEKHNAAVLLGWRVLYFTGAAVHDGCALEMLERAIDATS